MCPCYSDAPVTGGRNFLHREGVLQEWLSGSSCRDFSQASSPNPDECGHFFPPIRLHDEIELAVYLRQQVREPILSPLAYSADFGLL